MGRISAGIVAGLIGGIVFGIMMQMMATPDGMPMMAMVAKVVHSDSLFIGWLYHLFNSAAIGGLFGLLLGNRIRGCGGGLGIGALYGVAWWVIGALILMPIFLGMPAFAPLMMAGMQSGAMGSLMGHIIFGLILGPSFVALSHGAPGVAREA